MKKLIIVLFVIFSVSLFAQDTITGTYSYTFGDSETLVEARKLCKDLALREALESYAIYVESSTTIENYELKEDILHTISSGYLTNVEILEQSEEGRTITTTIQATVQPDDVKSEIEKKVQQNTSSDPTGKLSEERKTQPFFNFINHSEKMLFNVDQMVKKRSYKDAIQKLESLSRFIRKRAPDKIELYKYLSYECLQGRIHVSLELLRQLQFENQRKPVRAKAALVKANKNGDRLRETVKKFETMKNLSDKQKLYRASVLSKSRKLLERLENKT